MSSIFERIMDHGTSYLERNQQVPRYELSDADLVELAAWIVDHRLIGKPPSLAMTKLPAHPTSSVLSGRVAEEVTGGTILGIPIVAKRLLTTVKYRPKYRYC